MGRCSSAAQLTNHLARMGVGKRKHEDFAPAEATCLEPLLAAAAGSF